MTRPFDVYLVGIGYRGRSIGVAARRFVRHVSQERRERLRLPGGVVLDVGAGAHVVGYAGHNHLMDAWRFAWPRFTRRRPVGWFVLACQSAPFFAPALTRPATRALLLTKVFMYPGAFTIEGLLRGVMTARGFRGVYRAGVAYYARFQKRPVGLIRRVFTYGGKRAYRRRYAPTR